MKRNVMSMDMRHSCFQNDVLHKECGMKHKECGMTVSKKIILDSNLKDALFFANIR